MTVSTTANSVVYRGNGSTTEFAVPFKVHDEDHLQVRRRIYASGLYDHTYVGTDYSYSGVEDSSGTLTLSGTALSSTYELVIERIVPYTQALDIVNSGGFYPETVEDQLDLMTMATQQLANSVDRALLLPVGETPEEMPSATLRADSLLGFGSDGLEIEMTTVASLLTSAATAGAAAALTLSFTVTSAAGQSVSTRGLLAGIVGPVNKQSAILTEAGREGMFVFSDSDLSTYVTADTRQGLFVAPDSDATGASGAWVRQLNGEVWLNWFGLVEGNAAGANEANNDAAWAGALAALASVPFNPNTDFQSLYPLKLPGGYYEFGTTWDINKGAMFIEGRGAGHGSGNGPGTNLKFSDTTGIRLQHRNTSGATTVDGATHLAGSYTHLKNFRLEGNYADTLTEADYHGIHARTVFFLEDVVVDGFAGEGIYVIASAAAGGNANLSRVIGGTVVRCRKGWYNIGTDTNAMSITNLNAQANRWWGIDTRSGINITFDACHVSATGTDGNQAPSMVMYNGYYYFVIVGQEVGASTNAPSGAETDNTWWAHLGGTGASAATTDKPLWVSGTTYRSGGCINAGSAAHAVFDGCYVEGGNNQGKMQSSGSKALVTGGNLPGFMHGTTTSAGSLFSDSSSHLISNGFAAAANTVRSTIGWNPGSNANLIAGQMKETTYAADGFTWRFDATNGDLCFGYGLTVGMATNALAFTGPVTTRTFGRSAAVPYSVLIRRLFVPGAAGTGSNGRQIMIDTAAPSGDYAQGDFVIYRGATEGLIGFACRTSGNPATFESLYGMTAAKPSSWAAATGTKVRTTFNADTATATDTAQRLAALIDDLMTRDVI